MNRKISLKKIRLRKTHDAGFINTFVFILVGSCLLSRFNTFELAIVFVDFVVNFDLHKQLALSYNGQ